MKPKIKFEDAVEAYSRDHTGNLKFRVHDRIISSPADVAKREEIINTDPQADRVMPPPVLLTPDEMKLRQSTMFLEHVIITQPFEFNSMIRPNIIRRVYSTDDSLFCLKLYVKDITSQKNMYNEDNHILLVRTSTSEMKKEFTAVDIREFLGDKILGMKGWYSNYHKWECVNPDDFAETDGSLDFHVAPSDGTIFDAHPPRGGPSNIVVETENFLMANYSTYDDGKIGAILLYCMQ